MSARMSTQRYRTTASRTFTMHYIIDKAGYGVPPKSVFVKGPFGEIAVDCLFEHALSDCFTITGPQPTAKGVIATLQLFDNTAVDAAEAALAAIRAAEAAMVDGCIVEYEEEDRAWEACLNWFDPDAKGMSLDCVSMERVQQEVFEFAKENGVWPGHITAVLTLCISFKQPAVTSEGSANTVFRMEDGFTTSGPAGVMSISKFDIYDTSMTIDGYDKIFMAAKPEAAAGEGSAAALFKIEITNPEQQFSKSDFLKMQPEGFYQTPFVEITEITNQPTLLMFLWLAHGGVWVGGVFYKELIYAADKFLMREVLSSLIDMIEFTIPNINLIGDVVGMVVRWEISKEGMRERVDQVVADALSAIAAGDDIGDQGLVKCLRPELTSWLKELVARGSFVSLFG
jgi:hypothetical protein